MVTEVETATEVPELAQYVARQYPEGPQIPEALKEGAPVPPTWRHSVETWRAFSEAARQHLRLKPAYDFAHAIAQGYYPDELSSGHLRSGASVNAVTGRVIRPRGPAYDSVTIHEAAQLLRELHRTAAPLEPLLLLSLQRVASGASLGASPVGPLFTSVKASLAEKQRELAAAQAARSELVILEADDDFRAPGGRQYRAGQVSEVSQAQRQAIEDAWQKQEIEGRKRSWPHPLGPGREAHRWPPGRFRERTP